MASTVDVAYAMSPGQKASPLLDEPASPLAEQTYKLGALGINDSPASSSSLDDSSPYIPSAEELRRTVSDIQHQIDELGPPTRPEEEADGAAPTDFVYEPSQEDNDVEVVRAALSAEELARCDEAMMRRFIRATGGNLKLSIKRLHTTLAWRASTQPENMVCQACAAKPASHYMHIVGFCKQGRPVVYSCNGMAKNKDCEDNRQHLIQTFEMAAKCMQPGIEQWVWVMDFHGFGMSDINVKLARAFLDMSADHYPERLGKFILVDAPTLFDYLWKAIQPWVDPKTRTKISMVPYDVKSKKSSLRAAMEENFDGATAEWLLAEMAENRTSKIAKTKAYDMATIHEAAAAGSLCAGGCAGHNWMGTPELLAKYQADIGVLQPQGLAKGGRS